MPLRETYAEYLTDLQRDILVHWKMFPHLSQYDIAEDLGTTQPTVSRTISMYGWIYDGSREFGETPK